MPRPEVGIDTIGPPYYTLADGDGQTKAAKQPSMWRSTEINWIVPDGVGEMAFTTGCYGRPSATTRPSIVR